MNLKHFFTKNWIHFVAVLIMVILTVGYFSLQFNGYGLKQHDIEQFSGASHEIQDYRERNGEEILWTNSMFGGMPAIQISVIYAGNFIKSSVDIFLKTLPPPAGIALLYMLGFYIMTLCLRINPWIGLLGSIAFGFASYDIIIIQAGHNSKALAVAFMPPVVGGFLLAYQRNIKWGIILSALFMTIEISMNHLQVTYYLGILLFGLGIVMLVEAIRKKTIKNFAIATAGILAAYLISVFINYGNIMLTSDYAKYSIRGANDITLNPDGTSNLVNATTGLDKDYVTQYSNGIGESVTLISPYVKGSSAGAFGNTHFAEQVESMDFSSQEMNDLLNGSPSYWGDQPIVSGPAYMGIAVFFLAILGMVFLNSPLKWALLGVSILALALSWGKNFMGLTDFFLENIPGYNKFRAPTIIVVVIELCLPLLGILFLDKLWRKREELKVKKKTFLIVSGVTLVFLVGIKMVGLGDGYLSSAEKDQLANLPANMRSQIMALTPEQQAQYQVDITNPAQVDAFVNAQVGPASKRYENVVEVRKEIFHSSMNRSILFLVLAFGAVALFFYTELKSEFIVAGLLLVVAADLIPVSNNYLGSQEEGDGYRYWDLKANTLYPNMESPADVAILESELAANPSLNKAIQKGIQEGKAKADELGYEGAERRRVESAYKFAALNRSTNYRVFDMSGGFNSASSSFFHKALGGYHGAKLRNIQNLYEYHLMQMNNKVYDMMNVKYFIQRDQSGIPTMSPNPTAMGNAWFVKRIQTVETPNDEIRALGSRFEVKNVGLGTLVVGNEVKKEASAYGSEKLQYVLQNDTLDVRLQNGIPEGMEAYFVMDVNGKTNWVIKQTVELDTANSFLRLVEIKVADEFKPREEAIMLKAEAGKLTSNQFTGEGSITMKSYKPNKMVYESNASAKQLAVFSEIYFPDGWKATIDGKEVPILKTNYLLRGVEIPAGKHTIEFTFNLPKFEKSNMYGRIGGSIIVLLILGGIVTDVMNRKKASKTNA